LNRDSIKLSAVPQIEGLTSYDFLDYAKAHPRLLTYLPDERDWVHLDKHWICDVLYTVDTEGVQKMIDEAVKIRKERIEVKQNQCITMRPEFAAALDQCMSFTSEHYIS
jgi:hypothetical protein